MDKEDERAWAEEDLGRGRVCEELVKGKSDLELTETGRVRLGRPRVRDWALGGWGSTHTLAAAARGSSEGGGEGALGSPLATNTPGNNPGGTRCSCTDANLRDRKQSVWQRNKNIILKNINTVQAGIRTNMRMCTGVSWEEEKTVIFVRE